MEARLRPDLCWMCSHARPYPGSACFKCEVHEFTMPADKRVDGCVYFKRLFPNYKNWRPEPVWQTVSLLTRC